MYPARGCHPDIRTPIARLLFADTRMAWLWLIVRVHVGWEKLTGYSISIGSFGEAPKGGPRVFSGHDGFQR
jgi:thiosulfate dehydrogenase [quinone] large subunit